MSNSKKTTKKTATTKKSSPKSRTTAKKTTVKKPVSKVVEEKDIEKEIVVKEDLVKEKKVKKIKKISKKFKILLLVALILILGIIIISNINKDTKSIVLETHANEISEWKHKIGDKSIIEYVNKTQTGDLEGKTAEGLIIEKYKFKALKPGKTTIEFTFLNTKNKSYGEIKTYDVTVSKDLRLKIKERK